MEPEEEEHREEPERPEREEAGGACADLPARTVGAEPLGPLWAGKCMGRKAKKGAKFKFSNFEGIYGKNRRDEGWKMEGDGNGMHLMERAKTCK